MSMIYLKKLSLLLASLIISTTAFSLTNKSLINTTDIHKTPADIEAIFTKPIYKNAQWGLRVIDMDNNKTVVDINSSNKFFIGSVRKIFTVGELLNEIGAKHQSITTVHADGKITHGELNGNLVLIASGDLTMGGRTKADGSIAVTDFDHNEANSLGNAELTKTDPLAGYKALATQIKKSGINKISGDVVIDTRLFNPFDFRDEFNVSAIFVNDDVVDVIINPNTLDKKALITWRPQSAAFNIINSSLMVNANEKFTLSLTPTLPMCIGQPRCTGEVKNQLPIGFVPPFTKAYPLIQTFRITKPDNHARTVFIECLREAGINVSTLELTKENPLALLKAGNFYNKTNQIASLKSLPYGQHAKFILKVSYNIGADTSLVLFGLTQGVRNMSDSLRVEEELLNKKYGISKASIDFFDGSGGGNTKATNTAVTDWLLVMKNSKEYKAFFNALPVLATDGSLAFVTDFQSNSSLKGATGNVHAKTGTYITAEGEEMMTKGQALAGYINTKNNHQLAFELVVNNVPISSIDDLVGIFQDQGTIAATLWRDY